ncbi:MAG: ABC-ATPase domain-containing protein [Lachnospiraceae bacterium]|nr:ABC-ATPase domain-containing protein [Lachnospiraceae bacterium]
MRSKADLQRQLREIDHKGYKAYKVLEGEYEFGTYRLAIDHVQGDPFATPSRVRIIYNNRGNIAPEYFETAHRRIAVEDYLLRRLHGFLKADRISSGSGKSGLVTACRTGQEILERTAMRITPEVIEARIEVGFPAYGRTIAAGELSKILFDFLPQVTEKTFHLQKQEAAPVRGQSGIARLPFGEALDAVVALADDQQYIRDALDGLGLVAFVADGSVLPRESGVSQKPMKAEMRSVSKPGGVSPASMKAECSSYSKTGDGSSAVGADRSRKTGLAVAFESPESLAVTLNLPHRGPVRGMGIKKGITLIAGGGFHGKSTLLKALERGVYNHIEGDGRELVITDASAFKLRAEEGRCIHETDISMFISNLPTRADTTRFSTENASGSTSQAANTVEALAAGSRVLLIDEDTSATNFMVRDGRMAQLVSDEKEPITPFIRKIRGLYQSLGVSTILVVGSSGDYLEVADTVLQMDCYVAKDVTARAKELCGQQASASGEKDASEAVEDGIVKSDWLKKAVRPKQIEKARVHGWDTLSLDKTEVDLRYLEQIVDESQTAALAYVMQYVLSRLANGKKTAAGLAEEAARKIEKDGILSVTPKNYGAGAAAAVRRQEILACLARYRML